MAPPRGILDDSYSSIIVPNNNGKPAFSGGLVTAAGALQLGSDQMPAVANLIPLPGWMRFRGGYINTVTLPGPADGAYPFYDNNGAKHVAVWCNGNLYDTISGVAVLIASSVYTAGSRIGHVDFNGTLYWSCGQPNPVHMQIWTPTTATIGPAPNSGAPGTVTAPASDFLFLYINSIIACAPTWGSGASGGGGTDVYQPYGVAFCNAGDPTTWLGASFIGIGPNDGGKVVGGMQFGLAAEGISPLLCMVLGRNDQGVYAVSGAITQAVTNQLNVAAGISDPDTMQYLPTDNLFGTIVFLGTDGQVWGTNGVAAAPISNNILPSIVQAYNLALSNNPSQRFSSGYNKIWQYYWVDINGTQFAYRWENRAWTQLSGWPSGLFYAFTSGSGTPALFVAGNNTASGAVNYISQIAMDSTTDNGAMPSVFYVSPMLHGGNFGRYKDMQWINIATYDTGAYYSVQGTSIRHSDGSYLTTVPNVFQSPNNSGVSNAFIVGLSQLGGSNVLAQQVFGLTPGNPVVMQSRLACSIPEGEFQLPGQFESLKGNAGQFMISWAGGNPVFDLLGYEVLYVDKGFKRGAGSQFNAETNQSSAFDPYGPPPS